MFFLPRWISQGQTLPPPSDSVWRPSWLLSCKPEGKKTLKEAVFFSWPSSPARAGGQNQLTGSGKGSSTCLGSHHQPLLPSCRITIYQMHTFELVEVWTAFFTCNPHLLILSLGSLQMLQGFHTLSLPQQLSWLKRCLQIKGGGCATSEKAFVLLSLQSSTFTFKLLILHLGSPGGCLAWRWRCSRVPFLVNFPGWGLLAFKDRGGCSAREKVEQKKRFLCPSQIFTFTSIVLLVLHLCSPRKCPAWSQFWSHSNFLRGKA